MSLGDGSYTCSDGGGDMYEGKEHWGAPVQRTGNEVDSGSEGAGIEGMV